AGTARTALLLDAAALLLARFNDPAHILRTNGRGRLLEVLVFGESLRQRVAVLERLEGAASLACILRADIGRTPTGPGGRRLFEDLAALVVVQRRMVGNDAFEMHRATTLAVVGRGVADARASTEALAAHGAATVEVGIHLAGCGGHCGLVSLTELQLDCT